jgi:hypothetical protein
MRMSELQAAQPSSFEIIFYIVMPHLHRCCTLNNVLDLYYHFFLNVFLEDKMQQVEVLGLVM